MSLLAVPAVQGFIASEVTSALSEKLGTSVTVGRVNLGLLNRIVIDDVSILDQKRRGMIDCHRLSAKVNIIELLGGRISISSAQVFGLRARLHQSAAGSPLNCQFLLDSLASKDTTQHTPLDLHIGSLVIRNSSLSYDRNDVPQTPGVFNDKHVFLYKISGHVMLSALTDDSLSLKVNRLSFAEFNSSFTAKRLSFEAEYGPASASVRNLRILTPYSNVSLSATATLRDKSITGYDLRMKDAEVGLRDVSFFVPQLKDVDHAVKINAHLTGTDNSLKVRMLDVIGGNNDLILSATGETTLHAPYVWTSNVKRLYVNETFMHPVFAALHKEDLDAVFSRLGYVDVASKASGNAQNVKTESILKTAVGNLKAMASLISGKVDASVKTECLSLGQILNTTAVGDVATDIRLKADVSDDFHSVSNISVDVEAPLLTLLDYPYHGIAIGARQNGDDLRASLDIKDINADATIEATLVNFASLLQGRTDKRQGLTVAADIARINPHALGVVNRWHSTTFSFMADATINNLQQPLSGVYAHISDFVMTSPENIYSIDNVQLHSDTGADGVKTVSLISDFADVEIGGRFDWATLPQSLVNIVASKLPTLPGLSHYVRQHNDIAINATVYNVEPLQQMLGIDASIDHPLTLSGYLNDETRKADLTLTARHVRYQDNVFTNTDIHLSCPDDTLQVLAHSALKGDADLHLQIEAEAVNNHLQTAFLWDNGVENAFNGSLNATTTFMQGADGKPITHVDILPSTVMVRDTLWNVQPSSVTYTPAHLTVRDFRISHEGHSVCINGEATESPMDSIIVSLNKVNVSYIMNLVNFHSVEFDGLATGTAVAKGVFGTPDMHADLLVDKFTFETGRMGQLYALATWNNDEQQIDINAVAQDDPGRTLINGYVNIKRNYIDLAIGAEHTRLEFMQSFCSSFMDDVDAYADGSVRLYGDLKEIQLTGKLVANGAMNITPLGTRYSLVNDTIDLVPNDIRFVRDIVYDQYGHKATVMGALHHRHLKRMTYDLAVVAEHLLCFDHQDMTGTNFGGRVVGTGTCVIKGRPGEITFDIEALPEEGSEIIYDASSPDALQNQEFITWRNVQHLSADANRTSSADEAAESDASTVTTNLHMNMLIHANPDATIRVIMDRRTGDYITLNGTGTMRANYYNKGGLQIYGNYAVTDGEYKMTIQNVITKKFRFLPGGMIAFGGDPFEAALNLQAQYTVNSVSLSDLNIGRSFSSNTVRVHCLMNISGTPGQPAVDFDFTLPQASSDVQQMITSVVDSEEERNQQVLYLLTIGRFYAAGNNAGQQENQTSQTSLAMQSLLSGTISQQLNSVISDVMKISNWSFGANISPGDEGMNNAEYEGIISGRMLNNRLLINGQLGYRDNVNTTSFIGDFDIRYLLFPNGNLSVRVYNQASDRYFTKSALNTQGIGIVMKHDFTRLWKTKTKTKTKTKAKR